MRQDENWWETESTRELLHRHQAVPGTLRAAVQAQNRINSQNPEGTHRDAAQAQNSIDSQNPEEHTEVQETSNTPPMRHVSWAGPESVILSSKGRPEDQRENRRPNAGEHPAGTGFWELRREC